MVFEAHGSFDPAGRRHFCAPIYSAVIDRPRAMRSRTTHLRHVGYPLRHQRKREKERERERDKTMSNDTPDEKLQGKRQSSRLSRRNMLLTGTSILAAAGLQSAAPITTARAQQAAGAGSPPNILVIMADDVGCRPSALVGQNGLIA